jgi:hypothetical protein
MANSYSTNPVVLDTFTGAIDLCSACGFATGTPFKLNSIVWETPTNVGDTCLVTDKASGNVIFSETASVAKQSIVNYYFGQAVANIYIAISGVSTGKLIINLV